MSRPSNSGDPEHRLVLDQPGGNVVLDLFVLHQHLAALMEEAFADAGVTAAQYAVYAQLGQGPRTPGELRLILGLRAATLSGYLRAMDERGHLVRERDVADGRSAQLRLTPAGRRQEQAARRRMRRLVRIVDGLISDSDQVVEVRATLGRLDLALMSALSMVRDGADRRGAEPTPDPPDAVSTPPTEQ